MALFLWPGLSCERMNGDIPPRLDQIDALQADRAVVRQGLMAGMEGRRGAISVMLWCLLGPR